MCSWIVPSVTGGVIGSESASDSDAEPRSSMMENVFWGVLGIGMAFEGKTFEGVALEEGATFKGVTFEELTFEEATFGGIATEVSRLGCSRIEGAFELVAIPTVGTSLIGGGESRAEEAESFITRSATVSSTMLSRSRSSELDDLT